jgi:serine/threonine protein kinase
MEDRRPTHFFARIVKAHETLNMFQLYGLMKVSDFPALVMEYADGGSMSMNRLNKMWSEPGFDKQARRKKFALDIVSGLMYLHKNQVIHRNLKPDNILCFGCDPVAKISGFGLSRVSCPLPAMRAATESLHLPQNSRRQNCDVTFFIVCRGVPRIPDECWRWYCTLHGTRSLASRWNQHRVT